MSAPPYVVSTLALLRKAFPDGVSDAEYMPLLVLLYPYLSDRNLAEVVSMFTGRMYGGVLNDVYGVGILKLPSEVVEPVRARLVAAGFEEWCKED